MKISYAITCYNEYQETINLVDILLDNKRKEDEIVVLYDSLGCQELWDHLETISDKISVKAHSFSGDFSELKNKVKGLCTGDYIFFLDADEFITPKLIEELPEILSMNPEVGLFYIPRVNVVEGITQDDLKIWGWSVNENGWINWPDVQTRIIKNLPEMVWGGKVHESIKTPRWYSCLPLDSDYALHHYKSIDKQKLQNKYYETL